MGEGQGEVLLRVHETNFLAANKNYPSSRFGVEKLSEKTKTKEATNEMEKSIRCMIQKQSVPRWLWNMGWRDAIHGDGVQRRDRKCGGLVAINNVARIRSDLLKDGLCVNRV